MAQISDIQPYNWATPATLEDLAAFESKYNVVLGDLHRVLLLSQDGGLLEGWRISIPESTVQMSVPTSWLSLSRGRLQTQMDHFVGFLPAGAVIFCKDPGGSLFYYLSSAGTPERVYFLSLDEGYETDEQVSYPSYHLADSLSEFLAKLDPM